MMGSWKAAFSDLSVAFERQETKSFPFWVQIFDERLLNAEW
jgi:hypothetical protein